MTPQDRTPQRIAFLTPEFPTEIATAGGLSNYLGRMVRVLRECGHEVEVFTTSIHGEETIDYFGAVVHRVSVPILRLNWWDWPGIFWGRLRMTESSRFVQGARELASALVQRETETSFDIVQCSDHGLTSLFVPRREGRRLVMRCSARADEFRNANGQRFTLECFRYETLESRCFKNVDRVYAPCRATAVHCERRFGVSVSVVRPPFFLDTLPSAIPPADLPNRFLFHFGQLNRRKGTDVLAKALCVALESEPELKMVWAGTLPSATRTLLQCYPQLVEANDAVVWLGALCKPDVYAVLAKAAAVVVPSRSDNLPNTVLESLAMRVPVIASTRAGVEELFEDGIHGSFVDPGCVHSLARELIRAWRAEKPFDGRVAIPDTFRELEPSAAVNAFLELACGPLKVAGSAQCLTSSARNHRIAP